MENEELTEEESLTEDQLEQLVAEIPSYVSMPTSIIAQCVLSKAQQKQEVIESGALVKNSFRRA
jgi:hypothetical protein